MFPKKQNDGCNRYLHFLQSQWRRRRAWTSTSWATRPASPPSSTSRETLISLHKVKFCIIFGGGPCPNRDPPHWMRCRAQPCPHSRHCAGQGYRRCAIRMVLAWPGPTAPCSRIPTPTLWTPTRMQSGLCEQWSNITLTCGAWGGLRRCDIADDVYLPQFLARQKKVDIAPPPTSYPAPAGKIDMYIHQVSQDLSGYIYHSCKFPPLTQTFQNQNTSEVLT